MEYYLIDANTIDFSDDRIKTIVELHTKSKKERQFVVLYNPDSTLTYEQALQLFELSKQIPFSFLMVQNEQHRNFVFGMFLGTHGQKESYYTISNDPDFTIFTDAYHVEPYLGSKSKKTSSRKTKTPGKETTTTQRGRKKTVSVEAAKPQQKETVAESVIEEKPKRRKTVNPEPEEFEDIIIPEETKTTPFAWKNKSDIDLFRRYIPLSGEILTKAGVSFEDALFRIAKTIYAVKNNTNLSYEEELNKEFGKSIGKSIYQITNEKLSLLKSFV